MKQKTKGNIMLLTITLIWGTSLVAQSIGSSYLSPFLFNAIRFLIGALFLLPIVIFSNKHSHLQVETKKSSIKGGLLCGIIIFLTASFQQVGIAYTSVGKAGFITALYIVIVPILGLLLGHKIHWYLWLCVIVASIGMYFLCIKDALVFEFGDVLIFMCAITTAIHIIVIDYFAHSADSVLLSFIQFLICSIFSFIVAFAIETISWSNIVAAKFPILYTGILSCGVAYTLQIMGQKYVTPVISSLILSFESIISVISGALIFHEVLSAREIIGCVLIFLATIFAQLPDILRNRI